MDKVADDMKQPFKTSDLGLAAYLCTQGYTLLGTIESGELGRLFFVFTEKSNLKDVIEDWVTGRGQVSAKLYKSKLRACTRALKEPVSP